MKRIQIKELTLQNFKGVKSLHLTDLKKETFILGANGAGKTTVFDAFVWLLFGKDSTDRTNFEIKTLDENNNVIHKLEHEVSAILEVDGEEVKLQRIFKEKWVKKRGSLEAEFSGNETLYFWNDVPHTLRDYSAKVNDIVDENVFKLITSPYAFNALKWQDQREALVNMVGDVTEEEIARESPKYESVLIAKGNNTIAELQTQLKAYIRKGKEELKTIPTRIDEVSRNAPEPLDWVRIEKDIELANKQIQNIDDQIADRAKAAEAIIEKKTKIQEEIFQLKRENSETEFFLKQEAEKQYRESKGASSELQEQLQETKSLLQKANNKLADINLSIESEQKSIQYYTENTAAKRSEWAKMNAEMFEMDEEGTVCPACKREFDPEKIDELKTKAKENFDLQKQRKLNQITEEGKTLNARKNSHEQALVQLQEDKEICKEQILNLETKVKFYNREIEKEAEKAKDQKTAEELFQEFIQSDVKIKNNNIKIEELQESLNSQSTDENNEKLKEEKREITTLLSTLQSQFAKKQQFTLSELRKQELIQEESQLANKIASQEKILFLIEELVKEKITRLEDQINSRFKLVKFKLFETQVNGAEVETCKALINGVPFSDANTASKINAGLDIINTLSEVYQVFAPVFIDNRESVTSLIESKSQIINLVVSPEHKELKVAMQKKKNNE